MQYCDNMNSIAIEKFVLNLMDYHELTLRQQQNIQKLNTISELFFSRIKIRGDYTKDTVDQTIILESGHQPNFFPYSGIWKKAFLLSWFQKQLEGKGKNAIAYFGFADQNLSSAKILTKNHVPFWNKKGMAEIGFTINEKERFLPFCCIKKPARERWEKEIDKIGDLYKADTPVPDGVQVKQKIDDIITILWDCYEHSQNFAELNSSIFARICYEVLELENIRFYTFSDLCHEKIFMEESTEVLLRQAEFNQIFNQTILDKNLDLRPVIPGRVPFWYHCECSAKVDVSVTEPGMWYGVCPVCRKEFHLDVGKTYERLDSVYAHMDFSAVSRNIVFAQGMGTSLFLAGSGGSSSYGVLSDHISQDLGFYRPLRLSWITRDYYFGRFHQRGIRELMKTFKLESSEISDGSFNKKIATRLSEIDTSILEAKERNERKNTLKNLENNKNNLVNVCLSAKNLFQGTPSFIDLLATLEGPVIAHEWGRAMEKAMVESDGIVNKIRKDVLYATPYFHEAKNDEIPDYYTLIESIEVS